MSKLTKALRSFRSRTSAPASVRLAVIEGELPAVGALHAALVRFKPPYRLHLACGAVRFDGWLNLDFDPAYCGDALDAAWDLREALPLADGCVQFIYHEHFLEHLSVEEGLALLRESRRLLAPGGVLRVAMPDLAEVVRQYYENDWRLPWMKKYGYEFIQTRAENINISFRHWGHQWLYDREELHRRLREAGFERTRDCQRLESVEPELRGRETRDESLLVVEAVR